MINFFNTSLPNMSDIVDSWSYRINAFLVKKEMVDYELQENITPISFKGILQPASVKQIQLKPEGQRQWAWFTLHSTRQFNNDDIIKINNVNYRIMGLREYNTYYGYYDYELLQDYKEVENG